MDASTASFWFRAYAKHLVAKFEKSGQAAAEFQASLDPCSALVVKFCVKSLLDLPSLNELKHFVPTMEELKAKLPNFLPALAEALIYMNNLRGKLDAVAFDFLELSQQRLLFRSTLYHEFVSLRAGARVEEEMAKVRNGAAVSRDLLKDLLAGPAESSVKANLTFAVNWFADLPTEERIKFLFSKSHHFDLLAKWTPTPAVTGNSYEDARCGFFRWFVKGYV